MARLEFVDERVTRKRGALLWGGAIVLGVLMILFGGFAVISSFAAGFLTVVVLGGLLVAAGAGEMVFAFLSGIGPRFWRVFLAGLLSLAVGVVLVVRPLSGLAATTALLGSFFVALGLFRAVTAAQERYARWGWDVVYGACAVLLGGYVLLSWPVSSLWLVGTLVGVELLGRGAAWIGAGVALKRLTGELTGARSTVDRGVDV